jgi:hypothetical protein
MIVLATREKSLSASSAESGTSCRKRVMCLLAVPVKKEQHKQHDDELRQHIHRSAKKVAGLARKRFADTPQLVLKFQPGLGPSEQFTDVRLLLKRRPPVVRGIAGLELLDTIAGCFAQDRCRGKWRVRRLAGQPEPPRQPQPLYCSGTLR